MPNTCQVTAVTSCWPQRDSLTRNHVVLSAGPLPSWLMDKRNSPLTLPPGARGCVTEGVCISPHPGEYIVGIEP